MVHRHPLVGICGASDEVVHGAIDWLAFVVPVMKWFIGIHWLVFVVPAMKWFIMTSTGWHLWCQ
jgi:hypothetical protein